MRRLNALGYDPQLHPPHRQSRQSGDGPRGKRRAVVGANGFRQAVLAKGSFEDARHTRCVRLLHRLTAQQITRAGVGDGQRINAGAVASATPALEIAAPHPVRRLRRGKRRAVGIHPPPLLARDHQSFAPQQPADGARRRPVLARLIAFENRF